MNRSRRQQVIERGSLTMYVIAGRPPSVHNRASSVLEQMSYGKAKVVALPSSQRDGPLYPEALVSSIVRSVGSFAIRRRTRRPNDPAAPSSITLLYVPAPDATRLLRRLNFAVFPVAMPELAAWDASGRQLRHSFDALKTAFATVVNTAGSVKRNLDIIRERINRLSDSEALLLPPNNFAVGDKQDAAALFQDFVRGDRAWTDRVSELQPRHFKQDDMPRLPSGQTRRAFMDHRNLVFLAAHPTAYDGKAREVDDRADENELLIRMKGLYRFGAALPNGFHHDVQFEHGRDLGGVELDCAERGPVRVFGSHTNIFANDFVRGGVQVKI
jgi:hypothetical protein